jgi:hypothetical protein
MRQPVRPACLRPLLVALALGVGLASGAATASAQRHRRQPYHEEHVRVYLVPSGLYVGAGLVATHVVDHSGGPRLLEDGAGLVVYGGVRLSHRLAVELGYLATFHDPDAIDQGYFAADIDHLVLNGFTGDAKIFLSQPGQRTEFYVQGGVGLYLLDSTYFGSQSIGTGFQGGGGLEFHLGSHVDLGLRALYRGIALGPPDSESPRTDEDDTFVSAVSGEASLSIHF